MDDRRDRDVENTDRLIAQTTAAILLAYRQFVELGTFGVGNDRQSFVRFAALRLATVLRVVGVQVDALVTSMLTRHLRRYVPVLPSTPQNAVQRLETAFETLLEDEPLPEVDEPLEPDLEPDVEDTYAETNEDEDSSYDEQEEEIEVDEIAKEAERTDETREPDEVLSEAIAEIAESIEAEVEAEQVDLPDDQDESDDYEDEEDTDEDREIAENYRRYVEQAAERQRTRIERLIRTEIKTKSREAFAEALGTRKLNGVWITRPNACPICINLDGSIIEPGEDVPTSHPGCGCRIRPQLIINDPYVSTGSAA